MLHYNATGRWLRLFYNRLKWGTHVIVMDDILDYLEQHPWLNPLTWKVLTISGLVWEILFGMQLKDHQGEEILAEISLSKRRLLMFVTLVLTLGPLYYGLFRYSFE